MMIDRIESALSMLRTDLVQRFARGDWDEGQAERAAREVVACLQSERDMRHDVALVHASKLSSAALRSALRYIGDNLDSKLTWHEIAARIGVDAFGFGRSFKRSTGMTPRQYVIRCRVRHAMRLLARGDLSLADIALEVGCSCQSHLTTVFRKHTGTTPGAFRRAARDSRRLLATGAASSASPRPMQPHRTSWVTLARGGYPEARVDERGLP